jgi:serine/threonine-protein kinase
MLGQVILGKYKVSRALDEGGMSRIFLARQFNPARDVVVKVLKESLRGQFKAREHFRREILIMSRFAHAHAVSYYDSSLNDPRGPILVMEYLRGVDLNTLLHREGKLTPERTGRLLAQLCDVLQSAHDAGVVHRDLKPGNLMILYPGTPQETLKLMDFGLAKMTAMLYIAPDELVDFNLPAASGTPEYITPEMVRGTDMDGRGDLYSVGVVLFEMLTGQRPFQHASVNRLMLAHAEDPPPYFADLGLAGLVPPVLEAVVRSCLAKHPDQRPRSAWELALAYEKALGRRITLPRAPGSDSDSGHRLAGPSSSTKVPRPATPAPAAAPTPPADRNAIRHTAELVMPEALAMLKLKGFIYDLGGEVLESVPGLIRMRLAEPEQKKSSGLFAALRGGGGGSKQSSLLQAPKSTDIELHMERRDPTQPNRLTVTLVLRPAGGGLITPDWRNRCNQIARDLQAYLMGR